MMNTKYLSMLRWKGMGYFIMLKNLDSVLCRKDNKKQAQLLLSSDTVLPAVLAFIKEHLLCAFLDVIFCYVPCRKIKLKWLSLAPFPLKLAAHWESQPWRRWTNGVHTAHTTKSWINQWELWKSSKKNFSIKIFLNGILQGSNLSHIQSAPCKKIHGFVPGYKHLTDEATITIKLEEELVASPVLGEKKTTSFLVPCRSWAWCHLSFKN